MLGEIFARQGRPLPNVRVWFEHAQTIYERAGDSLGTARVALRLRDLEAPPPGGSMDDWLAGR